MTKFKIFKICNYLKIDLLPGADRGSLQDCLFCSRALYVRVRNFSVGGIFSATLEPLAAFQRSVFKAIFY